MKPGTFANVCTGRISLRSYHLMFRTQGSKKDVEERNTPFVHSFPALFLLEDVWIQLMNELSLQATSWTDTTSENERARIMDKRTLVITPMISPIPKKLRFCISRDIDEARREGMLERNSQWKEEPVCLRLGPGEGESFRSFLGFVDVVDGGIITVRDSGGGAALVDKGADDSLMAASGDVHVDTRCSGVEGFLITVHRKGPSGVGGMEDQMATPGMVWRMEDREMDALSKCKIDDVIVIIAVTCSRSRFPT